MSAAVQKLGQLQRVLDELIRLPRRLAREVAPEINDLIQAQFDVGVDPYGTAWKPLKPATIAKGRSNPPLTDTGRMRAGTRATALSSGGLALKTGAPYAIFHQTGTRRMARRTILPNRGMPASWRAALQAAAKRLVARAKAAR